MSISVIDKLELTISSCLQRGARVGIARDEILILGFPSIRALK